MRHWIARSLGVCTLAAALFAPVARADAPASATAGSKLVECTMVKCSETISCCNHCNIRHTICATANIVDGAE